SPQWLEKVLWGFAQQDDTNFEVVVADDGSKDETREVVDRFRESVRFDVQHIWHPDEGFQKCRILNKAILAAQGEYLVFTDGDCIPRRDFLSVHRQHAEPGWFLSGGYFKLPMDISQAITREDIEAGHCFDRQWLVAHGMKPSIKFMKLTAGKFTAKLFNSLTVTNRTFNGHNASCYKS